MAKRNPKKTSKRARRYGSVPERHKLTEGQIEEQNEKSWGATPIDPDRWPNARLSFALGRMNAMWIYYLKTGYNRSYIIEVYNPTGSSKWYVSAFERNPWFKFWRDPDSAPGPYLMRGWEGSRRQLQRGFDKVVYDLANFGPDRELAAMGTDHQRVKPVRRRPSANPLSARPQGQVRSPGDRRGMPRGVSDAVVKRKAATINRSIMSPEGQANIRYYNNRGLESDFDILVYDLRAMSGPKGYREKYARLADVYPGWKTGDFKLLVSSIRVDKLGSRSSHPSNPTKKKATKKNPAKKKVTRKKARGDQTHHVTKEESDFHFIASYPSHGMIDPRTLTLRDPGPAWAGRQLPRFRRSSDRSTHSDRWWNDRLVEVIDGNQSHYFIRGIYNDNGVDYPAHIRILTSAMSPGGGGPTQYKARGRIRMIQNLDAHQGPWLPGVGGVTFDLDIGPFPGEKQARQDMLAIAPNFKAKGPAGGYTRQSRVDKARWWRQTAARFARLDREAAARSLKKNPAKKKAAKKKAARKKTPPYQLLINRCQKLWTHYCERPSKKRLEAVYVHLDKMKASTSQKVKTERSRCLRGANVEAKKLKYKRK